MPTGVDDSGHDNLKQSVEARDRVLGGVRLSERGEITNVDEHHGDLASLTSEHVITLLEQPRRQNRVDVGPECALKPLPLSQTRLHAIERRGQGAKVVVLHNWQPLAIVPCRNTFGTFGEIANGLQRRRESEADGDRHREHDCQRTSDHDGQDRGITDRIEHGPKQCAGNGEPKCDCNHRQVRSRGKSRARARQRITDPGVTDKGDPHGP